MIQTRIFLARISHWVSSRGRRSDVPSGVFDPRGAERVLVVRRAPRGEKTPLGAVHRRPQQKAGEICRLGDPRPACRATMVGASKRTQEKR